MRGSWRLQQLKCLPRVERLKSPHSCFGSFAAGGRSATIVLQLIEPLRPSEEPHPYRRRQAQVGRPNGNMDNPDTKEQCGERWRELCSRGRMSSLRISVCCSKCQREAKGVA